MAAPGGRRGVGQVVEPRRAAPAGPPSLAGANVVLGVSGGIAAYKAVEVCRRLFDAGAHVSPVLTAAALRFVGAVTFSALASEPARTSLWDDADGFFYDHIRMPDGTSEALKVRSLVGMMSLLAVETLEPDLLATLPDFTRRKK